MSQTTRYAKVLPKIGSERSQLLNETKLRSLAETKNLTDITGYLRESSYQPQISKIAIPISSRKFEHALYENLIETYIKIIKNSPKKTANLLLICLSRFEIENIKALIKATNANLATEEKQTKIYSAIESYLKRLQLFENASKASTLKEIVTTLRKTEYAPALKMGLQSFEEEGATTCFDVLLDKHYYELLWQAFQDLPRKEKRHAFFYISLEVDTYILLMLLRGKLLEYELNWLRVAVPGKRIQLPDKLVEDIVCSADFDSALKLIQQSPYSKYFTKEQTPSKTIAKAENEVDKAVLEHIKKNRIMEIFNIGAVLSFLLQKKFEIRNLITISLCVEAEKKPEDIVQHLIL